MWKSESGVRMCRIESKMYEQPCYVEQVHYYAKDIRCTTIDIITSIVITCT